MGAGPVPEAPGGQTTNRLCQSWGPSRTWEGSAAEVEVAVVGAFSGAPLLV